MTAHHTFATVFLVICLVTVNAFAQVPDTLSFQGRFTDASGATVDTTVDITTKLYQGGTEVFTQTHVDVPVDSGVFSVDIGPMGGVRFDEPTQIGVTVGGNPEMVPRTPLRSVPFSHGLKLPFVGEGSVGVNAGLVELNVSGGGAGVRVESTPGPGLAVGSATTGILVENASLSGVHVDFSGDGVTIDSVTNRAIDIGFVDQFAMFVDEAGAGIRLEDVEVKGFDVQQAGDNGLYIGLTGDDAIYVNDTFGYAANLRASKNGASTITNHSVLIHNPSGSTTQGPDVLALKTESSSPNTGTNYITFFNGNDASRGSIEGNGSGVQLGSAGSDYAEFLPHLKAGEIFSAGDVVGVFGGHISRMTTGADRVMAITDQAIVVGNSPGEDEARKGFETVSFIGQVPVRVRGPARSGDFIVASGHNDGTAVALQTHELTAAHVDLLIGQAWEDKTGSGVGRVNTAVGLDLSKILAAIVARQQQEIDELRELLLKEAGKNYADRN